MIAVSFLQCFLGMFVFFATIGLAVTVVFAALEMIDEGHPLLIVVPVAIILISLIGATFIWLGSGPLNGSEGESGMALYLVT